MSGELSERIDSIPWSNQALMSVRRAESPEPNKAETALSASGRVCEWSRTDRESAVLVKP